MTAALGAANGGFVLKTGTGRLTLSNTGNAYGSGITVQAGSLIAGGNAGASTGVFGTGNITIVLGNASTGASDKPGVLINGAFTATNAITIDSIANTNAYTATLGGSNTTGTSTFSGNITLGTNTQYTVTLQAATGGTVEFKTGTWTTNNKAVTFGSTGNTGTVKLTNSLSTTGGVNVNFGKLLLGTANALGGSTTPLTMGGGTLDLNGLTDTVGNLSGASGSITGAAGSALTVTQTTNLSYGGTIDGSVALTKNGAGTLTLTPTNSYTGGTTITNGVVSFANGSLGSSGNITMNGGTLQWNGSNTQDVSARLVMVNATAATFDTNGNSVTLANAVGSSTSGSLTKTGSGTLTLSSQVTYTGNTTVSGGTLVLTGASGTYSGGNLAINGASTLRIAGSRYDFNGKTFTFDSTGGGTIDMTATGSGGFVSLTAGETFITSGGAQDTLSGTGGFNLNNQTSTFNVATGTNGTSDLIVSTNMFNSGGIIKSGSGTATFTANNGYTGTTTISAGKLILASGGSNFTYSGGNVAINGASTLQVTGARYDFGGKTFTFDSTGGGTIDAIATGSGGLVFTGSNTFTTSGGAQDTISGTQPVLGSSNQGFNLGAGLTANFNVATGTDATSDLNVSATLWNSGGITKTGAGRLALTSNNSYSGATLISNGTLIVGSTGTINSTSGLTINGGEFKYNSNTAYSGGNITFTSGTISGIGAINKAVAVGTGATLAPGNSPGTQVYGAGLTFNSGGTYQWQINNWTGSAANSGNGFTGHDLLSITGGLTINSASGSFPTNTFKIDINGLTAGNVTGAVPNFDPYTTRSWTIASATGGITNFAANNFMLDTTNLTGANSLHSGTFSITTSGNNLVLTFNRGYDSTTYNLAASAAASQVFIGGTTGITATLTNTGTGGADSLNYAGLAVSGTGALNSTSGSNIAIGGGTGSGVGTFTGSTYGLNTLTPSVTSATNNHLGGSATLGTTTPATVTVLDHSNASLASGTNTTTLNLGSLGNYLRNAQNLSAATSFNIYNRAANTSAANTVNMKLQAGDIFTSGLTTNLTAFSAVAANFSNGYTVGLDTSVVGTGSRTLIFNAKDDSAIAGASYNNNGAITISATATVGLTDARSTNSQSALDANFGTALTALVHNTQTYNGLESTVNSTTPASSGGLTVLGSSATVLKGTNTTGNDSTVQMEWRSRTTTTGNENTLLVSDVVNLTGVTGTFVLQMSYTDANLDGAEDVHGFGNSSLFLGWLNPATSKWENAILGNIGTNTGSHFVDTTGWIDDSAHNLLGAWGVDTDSGVVWAVVNHNSQFAVIPEPLALPGGLMLMSIVGVISRRRRKA